jgi:hypothetical protein
MAKANRFINLINSTRNATDKEEVFFEFLLMSPSFQLAYKLRTQGLNKEEKSLLPSDFNRVLEIFDLCGNIFETDFDSWWEDRGRDLLRSSNQYEDLIAYPVDLSKSANILIKEFTNFVSEVKSLRKSKPTSPITILTNKTRLQALHLRLVLVNDKGRLEWKSGKKIENWRLGVEVDIKSKWTTELKTATKNTIDNLEARTSLGILVSKHLKEALYLAENAARGVFPSVEAIDTGLTFDFEKTWLLAKNQIKLAHTQRQKKIKNGEYVRKTYYERKVKPMLKRQKAIEAMVQARLLLQSS